MRARCLSAASGLRIQVSESRCLCDSPSGRYRCRSLHLSRGMASDKVPADLPGVRCAHRRRHGDTIAGTLHVGGSSVRRALTTAI